jgi:hypothetical protein
VLDGREAAPLRFAELRTNGERPGESLASH